MNEAPNGASHGVGWDPAGDARTIIDAVRVWAQRNLPAPAQSAHAGEPPCQWCPLCQLAGVLRGEHPDAGERFLDTVAALAATARDLLDAATTRAPAASRSRPRPTPHARTAGPAGAAAPADPADGE